MSGLIEQLGTLRSLGLDGDEKQLQVLLRRAGYNVERAINHYFESGLPVLPSPALQDCTIDPSPATVDAPLPRPRPTAREPETETTQVAAVTASSSAREGGAPPPRQGKWPKLVGERWVTGYSTRPGSIQYREHIDIVSEGSGTTAASSKGKGKGAGGGGGQTKLWGGRGGGGREGGRFGRPKAFSAGAMSHILFRGLRGGVEGRLPREVCTFLAPLLQKGLVRAHASAVCDLPGLGVFADVPILLSLEIEEEIFALDPDDELYRCAYCLLQFAHTGHVEQEQPHPKPQQADACSPSSRIQGETGNSDSSSSGGGGGGGSGKGDEISAGYEVAGAGGGKPAHESRVGRDQQGEAPAGKEGGGGDKVEEDQEEEVEQGEKVVKDEDVAQLYDDETQLCEMPEARHPRLFVEGLTLRRYQRQALAWMMQREKKRYVTEEDCTGLSLGAEAAARARAAEREASMAKGDSCGGEEENSVSIKDGCVRVSCWGRPETRGPGSPDHGGGPGVALHPLWERRAAAVAMAGKRGTRVLSQPEVFYVNVYSRRFQRDFPPASLGCRGGILADEMGLGKTVMILSLILSDKERRQESGGDVEDDDGEGKGERGAEREAESCPAPSVSGDKDKCSPICLDDEHDIEAGGDGGDAGDGEEISDAVPTLAADCSTVNKAGDGNGGGAGSGAGVEPVNDGVVADVLPPKRGLSPAAAAPSTSRFGVRAKRRRQSSSSQRPPPSDACIEADGGGGGSSSSRSRDSDNGGDSDFASSPMRSSRESDDVDDEDGDSDFEPVLREAPAAGTSKGGGKGGKKRSQPAGSNRLRGGRWGGGKAGSDPSVLLENPYGVETVGAVTIIGEAGGRSGSGGGKRGGTLVVCPLSLIGQWRAEVENKTRKGAISVCFYYGLDRSRSIREFCRKDVVLTTYGVLSSELAKHEANAKARAYTAPASATTTARGIVGGHGLLGVRWRRVILDEAHSIRNTSTEQSRACLRLEAEQRWAVTGTPIQNSLDDVAALLAFLRHEPWCDRGWWKKVISDPYKDGDGEALRRLKAVLSPILLRRTKSTLDSRGRPIVELPPKTVEIVRLELSPEEREFYEALKKRSKIEFEGYVAAGTVMKSYIAILTLLLRLRQACNHPFLVLGKGISSTLSSTGAADTLKKRHKQQQKQAAASKATIAGADGLEVQEAAIVAGADRGSPPPYYVQELYRRYRDRVEADNSARDKLAGGVEGETGGGSEATPSRGGGGGGGGSLAFVDSVVDQLREDGERPKDECPVCLEEPMASPALTPCAHLMCRECLRDCLQREACCPVCRLQMTEAEIIKVSGSRRTAPALATTIAPTKSSGEAAATGNKRVGRSDGATRSTTSGSPGRGIFGGGWIGSTKLGRLEKELRELRRKRPGGKAVVFSQWTHMLDLVETCLSRGGFSFRRLDGSMSQQRRESALKSFETDSSVAVMLVSLKAGGVGLNLTAASTVILLDPWWNPAVEEQAIDRIHRLGQLNAVSVKRFVVSGTVEDKMLALQEVKGRMAKNALAAGSMSESQKLRVEDLIQFFK